jgi:hypothetical protein
MHVASLVWDLSSDHLAWLLSRLPLLVPPPCWSRSCNHCLVKVANPAGGIVILSA